MWTDLQSNPNLTSIIWLTSSSGLLIIERIIIGVSKPFDNGVGINDGAGGLLLVAFA